MSPLSEARPDCGFGPAADIVSVCRRASRERRFSGLAIDAVNRDNWGAMPTVRVSQQQRQNSPNTSFAAFAVHIELLAN